MIRSAAFKIFFISCNAMVLIALVVHAQPLRNPFPWVIPPMDGSVTANLPQLPEAPAGKHGMLLASSPDGHFHFADGQRIRFWGTTMVESACFPDSADAIAVAAHLQKYGFNLVRMYAFDSQWDYGIGPTFSIFTSASLDSTTQHFDSMQLHRLDWFIYQLKQHGIYIDVAFNVYRGYRYGDHVDHYDSINAQSRVVKFYEPHVQQLERQFMQLLMAHVNAYTGKAYTDEPAMAMIELTDQDPIFTWMWYDDVLHQGSSFLSEHQSLQLDTLFNQFLKSKYGTTQKLSAAWNPGAVTNNNLLRNGSFEQFMQDWDFQTGEGNNAQQAIFGSGAADSTYYVRVVITTVDGKNYGIYLHNQTCDVVRDSLYTLSFYAKTNKIGGRSILAYGDFGIYNTFSIDTGWKLFTYQFRPSVSAPGNGSLYFFLSSETGDVMLDGVQLVRTAETGLTANEKIENISVVRAAAVYHPLITDTRLRDLSLFYDSLSRNYCIAMRNYLRGLGVQIPIAGINNAGVLADVRSATPMDFVASTAAWDYYTTYSNDSAWAINNFAISNEPWGPLPHAAVGALYGKPMVISSFADLYPNVYQTESLLHLPGYAALQDYDGVFWQYYSADKLNFNTRQITRFDHYEILHNPAMMALMPAASAMFREGRVAPAQSAIKLEHDTNDALLGSKYQTNHSGASGVVGTLNTEAMFVRQMRIDSMNAKVQHNSDEYDFSGADSTYVVSDTKQLMWDAGALGVLQIDAPRVQGATGFIGNAASVTTSFCSATKLDSGLFGTYLWIALDTLSLDSSRNSLLVLSRRGQNSNTKWNAAYTSITNQWGTSPTILEPMKIAFNFHTAGDTLIVYPLDTLGNKILNPIGAQKNYRGEWRVTIDQSSMPTPWFLVEQQFRDTVSSVAEIPRAESFAISANYPEPFHSHTAMEITGAAITSGATFRVYDNLGRLISDFSDQLQSRATIDLDATAWPAGVYRCVCTAGKNIATREIIKY